MRSTNAEQFVDLCSGNGGPWFHLAQQIEQEMGRRVSVMLTDKFPSRETIARAESIDVLTYFDGSVDARCVPEYLRGVRSLFNGLHHFRPGDAKAVLQDAVAKGQPIAVFETLQRNWLTLIHALLLPISVLILTPLVRPLTWWRLLLTYIIPVAPLILLWDGRGICVSVLPARRAAGRWQVDSLGHLTGGKQGAIGAWARPLPILSGIR